jgi:tRNA threonylcarbamoyladenosine biosynthesis protein TsaE
MISSQTTQFHTSSPDETQTFGERIGTLLTGGMLIALFGGLGAGKTTLTKGIARGLGVDDIIHSPTFNLIHEHTGRMAFYHFDVYRLHDSSDMYDLGYDDYFYGDGVSIIEWPEVIADILPAERLEIHISSDGDDRIFDLQSFGSEYADIISKL